MKKQMIITTIILFAGLAACVIGYYFTQNAILFSAAITLGTCFYHFAMRLAVGYGIDAIFHNKMKDNSWWFRERKFEPALYKFLGVKKWKKHLPTYNADLYDIKKHTAQEIIGATCQANSTRSHHGAEFCTRDIYRLVWFARGFFGNLLRCILF